MDTFIGAALVILASTVPLFVVFKIYAIHDEKRQRDLNYREELRTMRFKPDFQAGQGPQEEGSFLEKMIAGALQNPQVLNTLMEMFKKKEGGQ